LVATLATTWAVFTALQRGWSPTRPSWRAVAACSCAGVALFASIWWSKGPPAISPPDGAPRLTALDVGQGQAILLDDGAGERALLDVGPSGSPAPAIAALRDAGIEHVQRVFISHDAEDHAGGLSELLDEIQVGQVLAPESASAALATARRRGVPVRAIAQGDVLRAGRARISALWPRAGLTTGEPNDASLVLDIRAPGLAALVPGDAESPVLSRLSLRPVDVLVVAHHGSKDEGLDSILARVHPELAIISAGRGNRHGHPAAETVAAIRTTGTALARTDVCGAVSVTP
jgi:competence protein ComEC